METSYSFLMGRDYEVLDILIPLHSDSPNPRILDCTHNTGKMWKKSLYSPTKTIDIDPKYKTDLICDFRNMPILDGSFDILIFDPPHLPTNAASKNSSKIYMDGYGITNDKGVGRDGDNVSDLFPPFLKEAKRVLVKNGIVLAKIADMVHNHKYQWQHVDFINASQEIGLTPCDAMIKSDPCAGNLKSSKWKNQKHLRKSHCYWLVIRNSSKCEKKD